jgi:hypothetical protein
MIGKQHWLDCKKELCLLINFPFNKLSEDEHDYRDIPFFFAPYFSFPGNSGNLNQLKV